jgi:hypothetical protein
MLGGAKAPPAPLGTAPVGMYERYLLGGVHVSLPNLPVGFV